VRILISAGEASGEMYGAQLIEALRRRDPSLEFFGAGGEKMRAAGCDTVVDAKDLSVVGITEILTHLPKIWGLFHKLIAEADRRKPDLAIVIDSPAFNWRVARQMKKRGIPVVYYVCPQFWAWRQGRVRLLRKYVDKALVIFPFEEKFYRDRGVDAEFVGHPLAELPRPAITRDEYATQHGLDPRKQWITLMPGSRAKELRMNLPGILEAANLLGPEYEFLLPVAPTLDRDWIERLTLSTLREGTTSSRAVPSSKASSGTAESRALPNLVHLVPEALPALSHSRAGIIASGTATVEAAMMETPFVMVYRVTPLTYLLGRSTVKVPHFAMVNLIAGERVVPELVQQKFTAERVAAEMNKIIPDGSEREKMLEKLGKVRSQLRGGSGHLHPADRAAGAALELLGQRTYRPSGTHSFPTPTQG
jgi:lipid-A-disaccharide synthase